MTKSGREIMEIFEAYDLTGTAWSAAQLTGCDAKTVARYVAIREAGGDPQARPPRPKAIDPFLVKVEELVDRSRGRSGPMSRTASWPRWVTRGRSGRRGGQSRR
jgi:hypothetical protein